MAASKKLAVLLAELRLRGGGTAEGTCIEALKFLDGNDDEASIGCNLEPHPGLDEFRRVVTEVTRRPDVSAAFVSIQEDMGDEDFPFTDAILVCTSAASRVIETAFASLSPDEVYSTSTEEVSRLPKAVHGHRWLTVWWD